MIIILKSYWIIYLIIYITFLASATLLSLISCCGILISVNIADDLVLIELLIGICIWVIFDSDNKVDELWLLSDGYNSKIDDKSDGFELWVIWGISAGAYII